MRNPIRSSQIQLALLLGLLLLLPLTTHAQFVQVAQGVNFTANTVAGTWTSNTTAGHVMACAVWWNDNTSTVASLSDSVDGALTDSGLGIQRLNSAHSKQMFYKENITGGTTPTVTATFASGATPGISAIACHEISGRATSGALDQKQWNTQNFVGSGTDFITSGSVTTTTNGQYIFGATHEQFSDSPTAGTGFTLRTSGTNHVFTESLIQTSAGSIAATFTPPGNGGYITGIMTFKASGGGGGGGSSYSYRARTRQ